MLYFFLFFIWIWILITVFIDIFRGQDLNGWIKGALGHLRDHPPVPGCGRLPDRSGWEDAGAQVAGGCAAEDRLRAIRQGDGRNVSRRCRLPTEQLADLKSQGVLTDAEFEAQKAKILATS